mgnify:FL=1
MVMKMILLICGFLALGLGVLGIFLPVLPTTPFLLLALACFGRSSDRLYDWIVRHKTLGQYINHYRSGRGLPWSVKIKALCLLWLSMGYSIGFVVSQPLWRWLLAIIGLGVTVHLLTLKTLQN